MIRIDVHVRPASRQASVGGLHGDALIVRVCEPAAGGAANLATERAVALALGVAPRDVCIVRGNRSRRKLVEVHGDDAALAAKLAELAGTQGPKRIDGST
jgi:uncharacterized protein YggU (UPF0235/DUF167 family)